MSKSTILLMGMFYQPKLDELEKLYDCHRHWAAPDKDALVASLAGRCEIVVTNGGRGISAQEMAQLPKLRLVACFGVGVDAIDLDYARQHGIAVSNTPDVLTDDVADMALALLRKSLDAFARLDTNEALSIIKQDNEIDREYNSFLRKLITYMMEDAKTISPSLDLLFVAKAIERIGDHAKNIAEFTIYIVKGADIRHAPLSKVESTVR